MIFIFYKDPRIDFVFNGDNRRVLRSGKPWIRNADSRKECACDLCDLWAVNLFLKSSGISVCFFCSQMDSKYRELGLIMRSPRIFIY